MLVRELIALLQEANPEGDMEVEMAMNQEYQSEVFAHEVREVVENGRHYVLIGD
jgi:hypothetical protein